MYKNDNLLNVWFEIKLKQKWTAKKKVFTFINKKKCQKPGNFLLGSKKFILKSLWFVCHLSQIKSYLSSQFQFTQHKTINKPRQVKVTNQIPENLDSNKSKFRWWFQFDSKSDNKIGFPLNDDVNLIDVFDVFSPF